MNSNGLQHKQYNTSLTPIWVTYTNQVKTNLALRFFESGLRPASDKPLSRQSDSRSDRDFFDFSAVIEKWTVIPQTKQN